MSDSDFSNEQRLDAICSEFEEQWSPERRDIGFFLTRIDEQYRDQLLRMLIEFDVELRQKPNSRSRPMITSRRVSRRCYMFIHSPEKFGWSFSDANRRT